MRSALEIPVSADRVAQASIRYKWITEVRGSNPTEVRPVTMETRCSKVIFPNYSKHKPTEDTLVPPPWGTREKNACFSRIICSRSQVPGTPPLNNVGLKNVLVETLNNVGHPTRCPQPPNSVRLMVSYIVQCLHNDFFKPTLCKGGVPATCAAVRGGTCVALSRENCQHADKKQLTRR